MELIYFAGVFVIFLLVTGAIGTFFYFFFGPHIDETCGIAIAAITLILFMDLVFSIILTGFIFSPGRYGYTKIQTDSEASINE